MPSVSGGRERVVVPRGTNPPLQHPNEPTNWHPLPVQDAGHVRFDRTAIKVSRRFNPAPPLSPLLPRTPPGTGSRGGWTALPRTPWAQAYWLNVRLWINFCYTMWNDQLISQFTLRCSSVWGNIFVVVNVDFFFSFFFYCAHLSRPNKRRPPETLGHFETTAAKERTQWPPPLLVVSRVWFFHLDIESIVVLFFLLFVLFLLSLRAPAPLPIRTIATTTCAVASLVKVSV